jgi:SAM-dependent methyltransferase
MKIIDPSFNYNKYGQTYSGHRQTEPEIAKYIDHALGQVKTVINVGAGSGSYEPTDRYVVAIEPSVTMRQQRLGLHRTPAVIGTAESIPFDDKSFDAATAFLTIHHWPNMTKGLNEVRRVTRGPILIMTYDPDALNTFWNVEYFPEVVEVERQRYARIDELRNILGGTTIVQEIPVPLNCIDGFQEAFYGRPEAFLSNDVRSAMSAWGFIPQEQQAALVQRLADALASGQWDKKYGHLRTQPYFTGAMRLITSFPG